MTTKEEHEKKIEMRRSFLDSLDKTTISDEILYVGKAQDNESLLYFPMEDEEKIKLFMEATGEEPPSFNSYILDLGDEESSFYLWERGELRGRTYGPCEYFNGEALEGSLPVYIVDNPLDMMVIQSTEKAEAMMVSSNKESLISFFKMWKERTEGGFPPVIVRLENTKTAIIKTGMISEAFEKVMGYEPMISTEGKAIREAMEEDRKKLEKSLQEVQVKEKIASSKKDETELEVLKTEEANIKEWLPFYNLGEVSTIYGLVSNGKTSTDSILSEIKELIDDDREKKEAKRREAYRYLKTATAPAMGDFLDDLRLHAREYIPTGFINIDKKLGGGWEEGNLYVIGAESSIGKTSLLLQIADNLSKAGADVLFFSLEMSRKELMAKSLSRLSFEKIVRERAPRSLDGWLGNDEKTIDFYDNRLDSWTDYIEATNTVPREDLVPYLLGKEDMDDVDEMEKIVSSWNLPKSFSNILHKAPTWDDETFLFMRKCSEQYAKEVNSVYIIEDSASIDPMSNGRPRIETIEMAIEQHKRNVETEGGASRPLVVCLDYLQLMKMESTETGRELSDKQAVDEAMARLRNIASSSNAIIIALSSVNRTSYNKPIHIESLKESGGVEYGADKIIGMEPSGMKEPTGSAKDTTVFQNVQTMKTFKETQGRRTVKIEILKNRGGALGYAYLSNVGMFGYFSDTKRTETESKQQTLDEPRKA